MNTCLNNHNELTKVIEFKMNQGFVLDASRMKGTRIVQLDGQYNSIDADYIPCLVKSPKGITGIDFFEKNDPIPLKMQVGLQCNYPVELSNITIESLNDILQSMTLP